MYGIDKWKAHRKQWRISEKMLLFLAVIGGSAGALAECISFIIRHCIKSLRLECRLFW